MNEKAMQALLGEISKLKAKIKENAILGLAFDHILVQLEALELKLKYQKVDAKDGGLILNQNRKKRLDAVCQAAEALLTNIQNLHNYSPLNKRWLPSEKIQGSELPAAISGLGSVKLFKNVELAMMQYLQQLRGGATMQELCKGLAQAAGRALAVLQHQKLAKTKNFPEVRKMGIASINEYVFDGKGDGSDMKAPSLTEIEAAISRLYSQSYNMTLEAFEEELATWAKQAQGDLNKLISHPFAQAKMKVGSLVEDLLKQCQALVGKHKVFGPVAQALGALVKSAGADEPKMSSFVEKLISGLGSFSKSVKVDFALVQTVEVEGLITSGLSGFIDLGGLVVQHVNQNDAHFVVSQANFHNLLRQRLNDWLADMSNAMGRAASAVLALDSCVVDGKALLSALTAKCQLGHISQKFQTLLALDKVKIHDQKDSKLFETKFIQPWRTCMASISVENDFLVFYEKDEVMLSQLYLNLPSLLPNAYDAIEALNLSIGGKVDLAREELKQFKKQVNARFAKVEQNIQTLQVEVKELTRVTNLLQIDQTASIGADELILLLNELHNAYNNRRSALLKFTSSYRTAEELAKTSIKAMKESLDSIMAIRGLIVELAITAITAGSIPPGMAQSLAGSKLVTGITKIAPTLSVKAGELVSSESGKEVVKKIIEKASSTAASQAPVKDFDKFSPENGFDLLLQKEITVLEEISIIGKNLIEWTKEVLAMRYFIGDLLQKKIQLEDESSQELINHQNHLSEVVNKFSSLRAELNNFNQITVKWEQASTKASTMERNIYCSFFDKGLKKKVSNDVWRIIASSSMRERLLAVGLINSNEFDRGWLDTASDLGRDLNVLATLTGGLEDTSFEFIHTATKMTVNEGLSKINQTIGLESDRVGQLNKLYAQKPLPLP